MNVSIVSVSRFAGPLADRTRHVQERLVAVERVLAAAAVVDGVRQSDGQVLLGHGHDPVPLAVDDRDRRAPVALAADQPVVQAVGDRRPCPCRWLPAREDRLAALVGGQPGVRPAVDEDLTAGVRDERLVHRRIGLLQARRHDTPDRQPVRDRERVVAFVVGRDGHDRAGPVATEDVVGDVDRDPFAVDRVDRIGPDRDAGLLAIGRQAIDLGPDRRLGDVRVDLRLAIRGRQLATRAGARGRGP